VVGVAKCGQRITQLDEQLSRTSGGDSGNCTAGMADNMIGRGCVSATTGSGAETIGMGTECSGSDDGGTLLIHVTARTFARTCGNYQIEVDVT
jgi:hypothetical protein